MNGFQPFEAVSACSRRGFLARSGAIGALGALGASVWGQDRAPAKKHRMRTSLVCGALGVKVASQQEVLELAKKHGFEAMEARGKELAMMADADMAALQIEMQQAGIEWGSCGLPVDFRGDDARFREEMRSLPEVARGLQRAGATRMNTWIGPSHSSLTYIQNFNRHVIRLREVAKILHDRGVRLGLEYVGTQRSLVARKYPFIHTLAELKELIASIGAGNVGFVLDSWHWWTAEDTQQDILSLKPEQVVTVDLNDGPVGLPKEEQYDNRRELPAATGVIDLRVFLNALNTIGYEGPVRAEPFNAALRAKENDPACAATIKALNEALALVW